MVSCERVKEKLIFHVNGSFNHAVGVDLKNLAKSQKKAKEYVIDLEGVSYINSSAFGVLLTIRETFGITNNEISLINVSDEVKQMLSVVNFDRLFKVD
jgi:anti-anti-sigma factor